VTTVSAIRIRDYSQLREALARRCQALGLSQRDFDDHANLMGGYMGKVEIGLHYLGPISLPNILDGLDCDLYLAPRSAAPPIEERGLSARAASCFEHRAAGPGGDMLLPAAAAPPKPATPDVEARRAVWRERQRKRRTAQTKGD
jgi:hypothetical protein